MDTKLAYLAGLVDGEGCFTLSHIKHSGAYRAELRVAMNDRVTIKWIHTNFGGNFYSSSAREAVNKEETFVWRLTKTHDLTTLVPELLRFLITKRLQAITALEFCQRFHKGKGAVYTTEERELMGKYAAFLQVLNSKGTGSNEKKRKLYAVVLPQDPHVGAQEVQADSSQDLLEGYAS